VVEPEFEVSAADEPEIKDFYAVGRAKATEAEVHLFALFTIGLGHIDRNIRTWASSAADGYSAEIDLLENSWRPLTTKGEVAAWSKLALVMTEAVKAGTPRLPLCVEATAKILGIDTPSMPVLNCWLDGVRRVPKRVPLEAPGDHPPQGHPHLRGHVPGHGTATTSPGRASAALPQDEGAGQLGGGCSRHSRQGADTTRAHSYAALAAARSLLSTLQPPVRL
jgi:hypothetical protein